MARENFLENRKVHLKKKHNFKSIISPTNKKNLLSFNGKKGKVRDTCLQNSKYSVDLKTYLGGGSYGMAFDGIFWASDQQPINVAIKLYIEDPKQERDAEKNMHKEVSKKFPDMVATFYMGTKCNIYNLSEVEIPSKRLSVVAMEKGKSLDNYLKTLDQTEDEIEIFDIIDKTIRNCKKFNKAGYLHRDMKPANAIISLNPKRKTLGGLLIDFGMTRKYSERFPPLDALYFLLTLYGDWPNPTNNILEYFAENCKILYTNILKNGITHDQIIGCFNGECPAPYDGSKGYSGYDIEEDLNTLLNVYKKFNKNYDNRRRDHHRERSDYRRDRRDHHRERSDHRRDQKEDYRDNRTRR